MKKSIIIVLVIGVISVGGLLYFFKGKNPSLQTSSEPNSQSEISNSQTKPSDNEKPSEQNYLVINEWNVRMKLTGELNDTVILEQQDNFVGLSTKQMQAVKGCEQFSLIAIERAQKGQSIGSSTVDELVNSPNHPLIKIGTYYYLNSGPSESCVANDNNPDIQLEAKTKSQLHKAFKSLENIR